MSNFDYNSFFDDLLKRHKVAFVEKRGDPNWDDDVSYLFDFNGDPCLGYFIIDSRGSIEYTDYRDESYGLEWRLDLDSYKAFIQHNLPSYSHGDEIYLDYLEDSLEYASSQGSLNDLMLESMTMSNSYDRDQDIGVEL